MQPHGSCGAAVWFYARFNYLPCTLSRKIEKRREKKKRVYGAETWTNKLWPERSATPGEQTARVFQMVRTMQISFDSIYDRAQ